jgi:7-carboxy-7-deazaguanine synthase (Cx14CxxC type)
MSYVVKEIYFTLQGEGANTGRPAVFCRFAGCNLWSGREQDRRRAVCQFCDTDFLGSDGPGGGRFTTSKELAEAIFREWPVSQDEPFVVFTGGEPALQLDVDVLGELSQKGVETAIETNGTRPLPEGLDWVCVSPKARTKLVVTAGDELKLVWPQPLDPHEFQELDFVHFFLQPKDGSNRAANTAACLRYCDQDPRWQVSLQTHKLLGMR